MTANQALLAPLKELRDWYQEHTGLPATAANAAIAAAQAQPAARDWPKIDAYVQEYVSAYEMIGDNNDVRHSPTTDEQALIVDCVRGLLSREFIDMLTGQQQAEPVAWVRFCSDGCYEGPLMNSSPAMDGARRTSGAWTPLFAAQPVARDVLMALAVDVRDALHWRPESADITAIVNRYATQLPHLAAEQVAAFVGNDGGRTPPAQPVAQLKLAANNWPAKCPITRRDFFMEIDGVPTYGGPFDSYTIPEMVGEAGQPWHERELFVRRYDHDWGGWVEDETIPLRIIHDDVIMDLEDAAQPPAVAVPDLDAEKAAMFDWLASRFSSVDFNYEDSGTAALIFEFPNGVSVGADLAGAIRRALSATQKGGAALAAEPQATTEDSSAVRGALAAPAQAPGKYCTVVYRDIAPGDEARELGTHPKMVAVSWGHALRERNAAIAAMQEGGAA